jgi:hypothetical protein
MRSLNNAPARRAALQTLRWEREYWDTFMHDEAQERKAIRYIDNNPLKAKLCRMPEDWSFSSAQFRDDYCRLTLSNRGGRSWPDRIASGEKPALHTHHVSVHLDMG